MVRESILLGHGPHFFNLQFYRSNRRFRHSQHIRAHVTGAFIKPHMDHKGGHFWLKQYEVKNTGSSGRTGIHAYNTKDHSWYTPKVEQMSPSTVIEWFQHLMFASYWQSQGLVEQIWYHSRFKAAPYEACLQMWRGTGLEHPAQKHESFTQ